MVDRQRGLVGCMGGFFVAFSGFYFLFSRLSILTYEGESNRLTQDSSFMIARCYMFNPNTLFFEATQFGELLKDSCCLLKFNRP